MEHGSRLEMLLNRDRATIDLDDLEKCIEEVEKSLPKDVPLENLLEDAFYRKLPSALTKIVQIYETRWKLPGLAYFQICKQFYTQNPTTNLETASNQWICGMFKSLEKQFGNRLVLSKILSVNFSFGTVDEIEFSKILNSIKEFKWYSASSIEIYDMLQYIRCYLNIFSKNDIKRLLNDIKRILDFLSVDKRILIEDLLSSFPKEYFDKDIEIDNDQINYEIITNMCG